MILVRTISGWVIFSLSTSASGQAPHRISWRPRCVRVLHRSGVELCHPLVGAAHSRSGRKLSMLNRVREERMPSQLPSPNLSRVLAIEEKHKRRAHICGGRRASTLQRAAKGNCSCTCSSLTLDWHLFFLLRHIVGSALCNATADLLVQHTT